MAGFARFTISLRTPNDPNLHEYEPNSVEYTYIASAINIGLAILEQERSKQMLANIASLYDLYALSNATFNGDQAAIFQWTNWFVTQLRSKFPIVVVDGVLTNLDCLGYHSRLPWHGDLQEFPFLLQGVHLNAARVRHMITAGQGTSEAAKQRFRDFQFAFATTIVHEVGPHILITWLGKGGPDTPIEMMVPGYGTPLFPGEAGRYFEMGVFGGTTEYYRDPQQDNGQTGVPHQIDNQGWAWRISPNAINACCTYSFTFPFTRVGNAVNPHNMQSMGRNSTNPPASGSRDHALMVQQGAFTPQFRYLRSYSVRLSDVMLVPVDPRRRLIAVA